MATQDEFDFVIVGGGTSGLVVANRLSEIPSVTVAVIEAGNDNGDDERIKVPGKWIGAIGSELDWNLMSTEQPGLNNRRIGQPCGRTLGGSSAINGQAFIPLTASVVDGWASLGNPDWTWERLRPYYQKFHTLNLPPDPRVRHLALEHLDVSKDARGPVQAYYATQLDEPLAPAWAATFKNLSWGAAGDPQRGLVTGGFSSAATIDPQSRERSYALPAYWRPAKDRANVKLFANCVVQKVLLESTPDGERATGVQLLSSSGGTTTTTSIVRARREVILAAGGFGSPKLLELSGVGNPDILSARGIETRVANKAVGEGMQDHLMTGISFEVNDDVVTLDALRSRDPAAVAAANEAYDSRREGPLTLGGINYFSFMPIDQVSKAPDPELERLLDSLDAKGNPGLQRQYEYLKTVTRSPNHASGGVYLSPRGTTYGASAKPSDYALSSLPGKYITFGLSLLQPFSRGSTHIASADAAAAPIIDPGYLSEPADVEVAALHLEFIEKLAATSPIKELIKAGGRRNASDARGDERAMAREWVRRSVLSNWHACGTASMMPAELGGVVSQRLLVHGTKNLRVVDASVMPIIPAGNILTGVYTVAERAADIIKEDHGLI